jgi:hypothetical protein
MKRITFNADESVIELARQRARRDHTTLNHEFRRGLEDYVERESRVAKAMATIERLQRTVQSGGRKFTRDEMNER